MPPLRLEGSCCVNSVAYRTYLFLEAIYLAADDESKEETDALDTMDLIWNLLTKEEIESLRTRRPKEKGTA